MGVFNLYDALGKAQEYGLDLVEIAPTAVPPVCKLIDYGKFRYQQTKREKINKKATHQAKLKEIKFKPNIDQHDLETKIRHAREFIEKGSKVKFTCVFRGREIMFMENGQSVLNKVLESLKDVSSVEAPIKLLGKVLSLVVAPLSKDKKPKEKKSAQGEN
jgi:translation initiation factor IF-3